MQRHATPPGTHENGAFGCTSLRSIAGFLPVARRCSANCEPLSARACRSRTKARPRCCPSTGRGGKGFELHGVFRAGGGAQRGVLPRSEWSMSPGPGRRSCSAMRMASHTREDSIQSAIARAHHFAAGQVDHGGRVAQPSQVRTWVMSPVQAVSVSGFSGPGALASRFMALVPGSAKVVRRHRPARPAATMSRLPVCGPRGGPGRPARRARGAPVGPLAGRVDGADLLGDLCIGNGARAEGAWQCHS